MYPDIPVGQRQHQNSKEQTMTSVSPLPPPCLHHTKRQPSQTLGTFPFSWSTFTATPVNHSFIESKTIHISCLHSLNVESLLPLTSRNTNNYHRPLLVTLTDSTAPNSVFTHPETTNGSPKRQGSIFNKHVTPTITDSSLI
jgi:hypothetical protein